MPEISAESRRLIASRERGLVQVREAEKLNVVPNAYNTDKVALPTAVIQNTWTFRPTNQTPRETICFALEDFAPFASIQLVSNSEFWQEPELPNPHGLAREILRLFSGYRLVPKSVGDFDWLDVCFGSGIACGSEPQIVKLCECLGEELYPIAGVADNTGILLVSPTGTSFSIGCEERTVYAHGDLKSAILTILAGRRMIPVLPVRNFSQSHNGEIYAPDSPDVHWIESAAWIESTRGESPVNS